MVFTSCNYKADDKIKASKAKSKSSENTLNDTKEVKKNSKVIYLTFDDGPSLSTVKILNTLKAYNVKATFFLIGEQIKGNEEIVKKIHDEGHSIGLHTYTHNYKKIYSNFNNLYQEMKDTRNEIYKVTGTSPNIIRFPGGSAMMPDRDTIDELRKYNFKVYDWNADSKDSRSPRPSVNRIYKNSIKYKEKYDRVILLLHCGDNCKNTVNALPSIIIYYKQKGFVFKPITDDTPEYISEYTR